MRIARAGQIALTSITITLSVLVPLQAQAENADLQAIQYNTEFYDPTACSNGTTVPLAPLTGDNNATKAYAYFVNTAHLPPAAAAGIVGNMMFESSVGPERLQGTGSQTVTTAAQVIAANVVNVGSIGWGIVQWSPPSSIIGSSSSPDPSVNTLAFQLDRVYQELQTNDVATLNQLKIDTSPATAASDFEIGFERGTPNIQRSVFAQAIFNLETKGTPLPAAVSQFIVTGAAAGPDSTTTPTSTSAAGPNCTTSTTGPIGACANPFRDVHATTADAQTGSGVIPLRVDQGVDYEGNGPIYPICNAQVILVEPDAAAGWPGDGDFIAYKLLADVGGKPTTGKIVYFAEDCKAVVTASSKTLTDQNPICTMNEGGTNIEIGWTAQNILTAALGGTDPFWNGGSATNYGLNFSDMLKSLGAPPGTTVDGISKTPLPAGWPTWP